MDYNNFRYVYPPRAEEKIIPEELDDYDNGEFIAQIKYNGSCCCIFTNGEEHLIFNRHGERKAFPKSLDVAGIHADTKGWMVVAGELMDKSKRGEDGSILTGFVMWDLLVLNGQYLVGRTAEERIVLLNEVHPNMSQPFVNYSGKLVNNEYLHATGVDGLYKAPSFVSYFSPLFDAVKKVDAYEGLVLKKANAKLSFGYNQSNNSAWQVKVRKPTKNYAF
jgi:ATP-dependent DNA ligase